MGFLAAMLILRRKSGYLPVRDAPRAFPLRAVVEALRHPGAYPHPVERVTVIQGR
jgi:hypothetical protein